MTQIHSFHIPVMGTAFTVDTPIKVAKYGISSVISIVDDSLLEAMRQHYCGVVNESYDPITKYDDDYRARRITAYLNLVDKIVKVKFEEVRNSCFEMGSEITKYFEMLANNSPLKKLYQEMLQSEDKAFKAELQARLRSLMKPGEICVNIMTKLDRVNFDPKNKKVPLPGEFSDALSALRGYAKSTLDSAIVFSAGINRRLYSYAEKFEDFYEDASGKIKKRIILKVSDYRSSLIQGRFFAKKGLWISEYRIESGLNCGGHAFASDGFLMGPILEEFKKKKGELIESIHTLYSRAMKTKAREVSQIPPETLITAQGGIGTAKENNFLLNFFNLEGTGWATPFLLVPEATNVDLPTLEKLSKAEEKDLYLSPVSPLGVPFNNLRESFSDAERDHRVEIGRPGSACPKGHLVSNTEFTEIPICTASRQYQKLKIDQMNEQKLSEQVYQKQFNKVTQKSCICNDLSEAAIINNKTDKPGKKRFTAICPGPNLAYFSKISSLEEMVGHVYGRLNVLNQKDRPNMFIKELKMYVEYFVKEVEKSLTTLDDKRIQYLNEFHNNMQNGIEYYGSLFPKMLEETHDYREKALSQLKGYKLQIDQFVKQHPQVFTITEDNPVAT